MNENIHKNESTDVERFMQSYYELARRRILDGRSRKKHAPANHPWRQYRIANNKQAS